MVSKSGISAQEHDGKIVLSYNGKQFDTVVRGITNSFGLYINGKKFEVDGAVLAQMDKDAALKVVNDKPYFGDVPLISEDTCINITLADYNTLFSGGSVDGYTRYNPSSIYNIVQDVSTAQKVTYTITDGVITFSGGTSSKKTDNMVYGGVLAENSLDLAATATNTNCPHVSVYDFYPIIPVNGKMSLRYYVDNKMFDSVCRDTISDTFTVIIETESGSVVKNTTYAGEFVIDTPAFSTAGETWFSVRCVDSNGVGSAVQFFDILVRNAVTKNYYTMQQGDLETYDIVPNDDTVEVAFANKAGFTSFFAAVKQEGYNGVVLLKNTYWIDYHASLSSSSTNGGANIVFPDGFTVDMNGSTFAATMCDDIQNGVIVELQNNFDTHIINGTINGNFDGFDFAAAATNIGRSNPSEGLGVTSMGNSRYCSFNNLEISNSVGYECGIGGSYGSISYPTFTDGQRINLSDGTVVSETGMSCTGSINISGVKEVSLGRNGYAGYMGTQREILFSFYDASNAYIKTIKSKQYFLCKVPSGSKYVRVSGFGPSSSWPSTSDAGQLNLFKDPQISKNVEFTDCYWHNTRTSAITPSKVKGLRFINCSYKDIATLNNNYAITRLLGDFEDGWQWLNQVTFKGCSCVKNNGDDILNVIYCNGFNFSENEGIYIRDNGGFEYGIVENSNIPAYEANRNSRCLHPAVVYKGNTIGTLTVSYDSVSQAAEKVVAMRDSTITKYCSYGDLHLRRTKNGSVYFE